ncbi:hypothetical protein DPX39_040046700 [Trypanosoma brucei equiperdum]|uniref:Uncharacterized protein n=1 Tax=Trypanosoma brucei equiperdum TaxID=630700 RepID=A0A3L6L9M4_9TRYP|nr:hypothetical protein DPX39_040046700 [Trypanosoma brucei equiperdum]
MKGSTSNSALWVTADQRSSERLEEKDVDYSKEPLFFDIPPIQQADAAVRPVKSTRGIPWRRIRESGVIAPDLDLKPPSPIRVVIDIRDKRERKGSKDDGVFAALPPRSGSFSLKSSRDVPGPPKTVEELLGAQWGPQCTGRASSDSETGYVSPSLVEVATTAVTTAAGNKHVNPRFTGDALILRSPRQTRAVLLRREFNARTAREKVLNAFAQSTPRSLPTSKRPSIDLSEEYNAVARRRGAWVGVKGFPAAAATWVGSASCLGWPTGLPPRGKSSASPRTMKSATSLPFDPHSVIERNRECDDKRKVQGSSPYLSAVPSPALRGNCSSKKNTGTATNEHVGGPAPRIASCSIASFDDHFSSTSPRKGTVNNENTGKSLTDWPMTSVARRTNVPYELTSSVDSIDTEEFDYEKCLLQKNDHYATQSHGHPGKNRCKHSLGHDNDSCQLNIVEVSDVTEVDGPTKAGQAGHCRHKMNLSTGSCVPFFRELLDGRGKLQDDTSSIAFETLLEPNAIVGATLSGLQTARRAEPQTTNERLRDDTSSIAFETLLEPNAIVGATLSGLQTARRAEPQTTNEKLRDDTSSIAFETLLEPNAIVGATLSGLQTARRAEPQTTNEKLRDDTSSIAFETLLEPNAIVGATLSGLQTARIITADISEDRCSWVNSTVSLESLSDAGLGTNNIVGDFMTSDVIVDSLGESPQGNSGVRDEVQSESRDTFTGESSLTPRSLKSCFDNGETDSLPPILRSGARSVIVPNSSRVSFSGAGTRKTLSEVRRPSSDNGDGCVISTRSSSPRLWTPSKIRIRGEDILVPRHHRTENKGVRVDSPAGRSVLSTYATLRNRNYLGLMRRYFLTWKGLAKHCTTRTASTIGQSPTTCGSCVDDSSCGFVPTTAVVASLAAAAAAAAPTSSRAHGVNNPHSDPSKIRNLTARSLKLLLGDNYHSADYVYNHLRRKRLGQPRSHYRMVPPDEDDYVSSGSRHRSICSAETSFSYPSDDVTTPISMT